MAGRVGQRDPGGAVGEPDGTTVHIPGWLRLSRRSATWKEAEILLLRHQLAVLQRTSPPRKRLAWSDRAWLAALLALIQETNRDRLRLLMPRMNSVIERWIGSWRRELIDRTLVWNLTHLRRVLPSYERHHNQHPPHRALAGAAPLKPLPPPVTDLDKFRARRHYHIVVHEYRPAA